MAFSVKQVKAKLQEYGVPAENLDTAAEYFCSAHKTDLDAIKEQRDTYKADAETLAKVQKELDELKAAGNDGYKEKYEKEHKAFEDFKKDQTAKETLSAKEKAFRAALKEVNINEKRMDTVVKAAHADGVINGLDLDENGAIKDADKLKESIKADWADFVLTVETRGADIAHPPANTGGGTLTKADIYRKDDKGRYVMTATERQKALIDNKLL